MLSPLTQTLIEALRILPGVGPKTAQRMAFELLQSKRTAAVHLSEVLSDAMENIQTCQRCRTWTEAPLCACCQDPKRHKEILCVVESPSDIVAIEQTHSYRGQYFVLHGRLSPLDGVGPDQLGLDQLLTQAQCCSEVIIATNPTIEGEATAHYIAKMFEQSGVICSRIAHGVPLGGELEYLDGGTVARAFQARTHIKQLELESI